MMAGLSSSRTPAKPPRLGPAHSSAGFVQAIVFLMTPNLDTVHKATFCRFNRHQRKNYAKSAKQKREKQHTTIKSIFNQHADPTRARTRTEHGSNCSLGYAVLGTSDSRVNDD